MTRTSVQMICRFVCVGLFAIARMPELHADENGQSQVFFTWALDDHAAGACIDKVRLQHLVRNHLGRNVFTNKRSGATRIAGQLSSGGEGGGWIASFQMFDGDDTPIGERHLQVPTGKCPELDHAISLVLALLIDPNLPNDSAIRDMIVSEEQGTSVSNEDAATVDASVHDLPETTASAAPPISSASSNRSVKPQFPVISPPSPRLDIHVRQSGPLVISNRAKRYRWLAAGTAK